MKKENKRAGAVIAFVTDLHAGHKLGFMRPGVRLRTENERGEVVSYEPTPTASQSFIWGVVEEYLARVLDVADGREIILLIGGDECHGTAHPAELISNNPVDQIEIAFDGLKRIIGQPNIKTVRLIRGTPAHNLGHGATTAILENLLSLYFSEKDIRAVLNPEISIQVGGGAVTVDVAHHGPHYGIRAWTRGNVARLYCRDLMDQYLTRGMRPPDLVLRGHYHENLYVEENKEDSRFGRVKTRLYSGAAFCMLDDYVSMVTKTKNYCRIGGACWEVVDGAIANEMPIEVVKEISLVNREVIDVNG